MHTGHTKIKSILQRVSLKSHWKEIIAVLMLLLAFVFFRSERKELSAIIPELRQANEFWLLAGLIITIIYIYLQGGINKKSFAAVNLNLPWIDSVTLFLKRNFVSVFLPAGAVSSLAYSPSNIRRKGFKQSDINQASGLFGFVSLLTVFFVGVPVVVYIIINNSHFKGFWLGLIILLAILVLLYWAFKSIKRKGVLFSLINKYFPSVVPSVQNLVSANINSRKFTEAVGFSTGVELTGIIHIYIAMLAIGAPSSIGVAAVAYTIAVLMMIISPFLRGLGAVEISMVYVLTEFGYSPSDALSITILFRIFEFWLPLLAGLISFSWKGRKLFLRVAPVLLIFLSGIINVISVLTPPLQWRLRLLKQYLPPDAIHASNILVLFLGIALLITSAYLIRGLKNAWRVAVIFTIFSLIGNLTKALDYEEAAFCFITLMILLSTASQYRIKSSAKKIRSGLLTSFLVFFAVLAFGFISFYFINPRHFGENFTWQQSLVHTLRSFLLVEDTSIVPVTKFGKEYIWIVRGLGFFTWLFLLYSLIRTDKKRLKPNEDYKERTKFLLEQYGRSAMDYFKTYKDKLVFISEISDAFIAYKISGSFAIVLEGPVCPEEDKLDVLREFQSHCYKMGLKPAYYRVSEESLPLFETLKKRKLIIGQEAILDAKNFTLEGRDKKSLRNGLNTLQKNGFSASVCYAPHDETLISQLQKVSDEWLQEFGKSESVFSQGMFDAEEIKNQDVIILENSNKNIKAFLNIVPDFAADECTYDLIRKATDAPGAAMDALIVKMIAYAGEKEKQFINLGMVPMIGISETDHTAEKIIKVAGERLKRFQHYKGLRQFKEKYATIWENKYLIYENDFDLLQLPVAVNNIMKP